MCMHVRVLQVHSSLFRHNPTQARHSACQRPHPNLNQQAVQCYLLVDSKTLPNMAWHVSCIYACRCAHMRTAYCVCFTDKRVHASIKRYMHMYVQLQPAPPAILPETQHRPAFRRHREMQTWRSVAERAEIAHQSSSPDQNTGCMRLTASHPSPHTMQRSRPKTSAADLGSSISVPQNVHDAYRQHQSDAGAVASGEGSHCEHPVLSCNAANLPLGVGNRNAIVITDRRQEECPIRLIYCTPAQRDMPKLFSTFSSEPTTIVDPQLFDPIQQPQSLTEWNAAGMELPNNEATI